MTVATVVNELQQKYNIVAHITLHDHSEKDLYELLKTIHKDEYNELDRIVIQYTNDTYLYQDQPGLHLTTFYKYISEIDIPNFFIIFVTTNTQFSAEFAQLTSTPVNYIPVAGDFVRDLQYKRDTMCILPWMHLYVGTNGNVLPCCWGDQNFPIGNIKHQSIDSIINSAEAKQIRSNMIAGVKSKECSRCYAMEDSKFKNSYRTVSNKEWNKHVSLIDGTNPDGSINNFIPYYIDIRLNNICNLKCRMCSGYFSSSVAQEERDLFGNSTHVYATLTAAEKTNALLEVSQYLPNIEKIYFAGGEPLIMSEHYDILDKLIECGNTDLEIFYNTNFTNLRFKDRNILDYWNKFSNVTIGASLDAMGDVAEYVRHGTKWSQIEKNLETLRIQCPHVKFKVTSVVSFLTAESLMELQREWHVNKGVPISDFELSTMIGPQHLTLQVLPMLHKLALAEKIKQHTNWLLTVNATGLASQWDNALNFMMAVDCSYMLSEFQRLTHTMDKYRNESFNSVFPNFQDLL